MSTINHRTRLTLQQLWTFLAQERIVLSLLAATFALLAWQHWGMNRTLVLDRQNPKIVISTVDDRADRGTSVCTLDSSTSGWRMTYDVRPGGDWAYCGIRFSFVRYDSSPGIDLSRFDTLIVNLNDMTGANKSLQVQMMAMDTNIYRPGQDASLKHQNMILFSEHAGRSRNPMPLDRFVLPPWWVARNNVPVRFLNPSWKDVRHLEFMTSADVIRLGQGTFGIHSLEFHGKWIDQPSLLKFLFVTWLAYILSGLGLRLYKSLASIRKLQTQTTELQELAERDPLTRLHNRRGLENQLNSLANQFLDPTNPVIGVLMIDLDHFKTVNDTLGHDAGDEILRILSKILLDEMRPKNLAARWGGEEFILLFPGISKPRLQPVAEKIRSRIEADLHYDGMRITASIGIAHGDAADFEILAKRADEALYRAKEGGRNRVEVASAT
ncbi:MAG: GGDEF domain-containing protein [Fibrobacterota bacterium]